MANVKTNNAQSRKGSKYDVVLSFAEEDRAFVDRVAGHLRAYDIRFFYDDDKRIETWGVCLDEYLDKVYRTEATYCVLFISEPYKNKRWTKFERLRAQARSFYEHGPYLLPFKLDATEIEEIPGTIAYLSVDRYDEQQLAQAIIDKFESQRSTWSRALKHTAKTITPGWRKAALVLISGGLLTYSLADRFTPPDMLARKLYERSRTVYNAARCKDSTISHAKGRGSCSDHEGVAYRFPDTVYSKTMEQCEKEAAEISLIK